MEYGLIGKELKHSYSSLIHDFFDYNGSKYVLKEIKEEDIDEFIKSKNFKGINVTIPYKKTLIKYLDYVHPNAKEIGSVNVIKNDNNMLKGYNTDYDGFLFLIKQNKIFVCDKICLVLGDGGASLAIIKVLKDLNARKIYVASRKTKSTIQNIEYIDYESIYKDNIDIIVNTTNVGMYPNILDNKLDNREIDFSKYKTETTFIDVIYNPQRTLNMLKAKENGLTTFNGLDMLIFQAIKTFEIFVNKELSEEIELSIYEKIKARLENLTNIVLIGMSGCGKTTKGKELSVKLNKEFIDTDLEITNRMGISIKEIFEKYGENYFRKIEKEIIKEISLKENVIISTGGGVILDIDNIHQLKTKGFIYFIDKDIDEIINNLKFDGERPLLKTKEDVKNIYEARIELYKKYSDKVI